MINIRSLELKFLQLEETLYKSRTNSYSDKKKEGHFNELNALFFALKEKKLHNLTEEDCNAFNIILEYIENDIVFLNDSTLNNIPFELVYCLEKVLEDWLDIEKIIISTTLTNRLGEFYFQSNFNQSFINNINDYLERKSYNCKISHQLVKMGLPKNCTRDYLANVVMYHELGHFVDSHYNISEKVYIKNYPSDYILDFKYNDYRYNYISEYFADLFAAQYVSDASNLYLNYIANGNKDSITHPATSKRIDVVNDFLEGRENTIIRDINEMLYQISSKRLIKRYVVITNKDDNLKKLIPQNFNNIGELHYIFKLGWKFWEDYHNNVLREFTDKDRYFIVNNLVEKSISNHAITEQWLKEL